VSQRDKPGLDPGKTRCPPPCGKVRFATRKQAKAAARKFYSEPRHMRAYRCSLDGQWFHLTTGDAATAALYREQAAARRERAEAS
jgi:hypothetical protein